VKNCEDFSNKKVKKVRKTERGKGVRLRRK